MPTFRCNNPLCGDYGKEELIPHVRFIWNEKTKKLEAEEAECLACNEQREVVQEPGPIKIPWFKAENARNYDNKKVKQYDYDRDAVKADSNPVPLSRGSIEEAFGRN